MSKLDITQIREDIPLVQEGKIYLDHAAGSIPPHPVVQSIVDYMNEVLSHGPVQWDFYMDTLERISRVKERVVEFIGGKSPNEIAFTTNGSEALNIIINGINWKKNDEVIITTLEITSGFVPFIRLTKTQEIEVKVVETDSNGIVPVREIERLISKNTKLILLNHISNAIGTLQSASEVGKIARENEILFLINASQSAGQIPIDVKQIQCDFLATPCRKWLRGPQGLGFLYCRSDLVEKLEPSYISWTTSTWNTDEFDYEHLKTAERFEAGEANFPAIMGFESALKYIDEIGGMGIIRDRIKELTKYTLDQLENMESIKIYGIMDENVRGGIVSFNKKEIEPNKLMNKLARENITIEAGGFAAPLVLKHFNVKTCARICTHYFNTYEEIDKLIQILKKL